MINDDYFGTLATVLDLLRQELEKEKGNRREASVLKSIVKDLMHLQADFKIAKKEQKRPNRTAS